MRVMMHLGLHAQCLPRCACQISEYLGVNGRGPARRQNVFSDVWIAMAGFTVSGDAYFVHSLAETIQIRFFKIDTCSCFDDLEQVLPPLPFTQVAAEELVQDDCFASRARKLSSAQTGFPVLAPLRYPVLPHQTFGQTSRPG